MQLLLLNMNARKISFVMLPIFFMSFSLEFHLSIGADTISANKFLSGDQTLVSSNSVFELGFFKPGKSSNYYIGIWYKNIPQTVVWVANREAPVSNKYSAELKIIDGNLVLINMSKNVIWSTNINSTTSNSVEAVLLNTGNLMLRNRITSSTIWQSFDHPTDTWLPYGKLLFARQKVKKTLSAWKNLEDPAPGVFSYYHQPNATEAFMSWNGTQQYWTSGSWNYYVSGVSPQMRNSTILNFSYVNNDTEGFFTYYPYVPSSLHRYVLEISGRFSWLSWSDSLKEWTSMWSVPKEQCDVYAYCGAFGICSQNTQDFCACLTGFEPRSNAEWDLKDFSGGCVRKTNLQCGIPNGEKDKFWMYNDIRLPQGTQSFMPSAEECKSACLSNCSCLAYGYSSGTCSIWNGGLLNLKQLSEYDVNGKTIYVRLAASESLNAKSRKGILVGGAIAASVLLSGLILMAFWCWRRRTVGFSKAVEGSLVAFNFNDLRHATKNFSQRLGGGGFGSVFKGTLHDSSVVAVKKLESINQGEKQFRTEVSTLGTIHHVNLVRLRGFCSKGKNKLLVYDYMENGSLDHHLFNETSSRLIDWNTRYQIALGTARGLAYLHEKCKDYIIHSDVKPENILLDANFCPKLADFGLAKLVGRDFSRVLTSIRGTIGYLAPEWLSGVAITTKADVYSYGMVLFELISGRRNYLNSQNISEVDYFPCRATSIIVDGGDILNLLDQNLDRIADAEEVSRMCKVAIWCIQDEEDRRPSMGQIIQILEGVLEVNVPPEPLLLRMFDHAHESSTNFFMKVTSNV